MNNTPYSKDHISYSAEDNQLFIENLNRSFCAISHLNERLTDIADDQKFADITSTINKLEISTKEQLHLFDKLFLLLGNEPEFSTCSVLIDFMEELFDHIHVNSKSAVIRNLHISSYVDFIGCINTFCLNIMDFISRNSDN